MQTAADRRPRKAGKAAAGGEGRRSAGAGAGGGLGCCRQRQYAGADHSEHRPTLFHGDQHVRPHRGRGALSFLYRYVKAIPEAGKFAFLDSGWMDQVVKERLRGELEGKAYARRLQSVLRFERQLTDNGYLVLKLFLQISHKERKSGWMRWPITRTPPGG